MACAKAQGRNLLGMSRDHKGQVAGVDPSTGEGLEKHSGHPVACHEDCGFYCVGRVCFRVWKCISDERLSVHVGCFGDQETAGQTPFRKVLQD